MKSKELIKLLQEIDSTGETEVSVGNIAIVGATMLGAYYDGALQVLITDDKNKLVGAKYKRLGNKIVIDTLSIHDAIFNYEIENNIDYSELSLDRQISLSQLHQKSVKFRENLHTESEISLFIEWVEKETLKLTEDVEDAKDIAISFYKSNLSHKSPIKIGLGESYNSSRHKQWDAKYRVLINENGFLEIKEK